MFLILICFVAVLNDINFRRDKERELPFKMLIPVVSFPKNADIRLPQERPTSCIHTIGKVEK